jgi:hypothetical protein
MLFGQYLLEAEVVSEEQLLEALLVQQERRTSLPRLAFESGIVDRSSCLGALHSDDSPGFVDGLAATNQLSPFQLERLISLWRKSAPPLGMLLVELGFISDEERIAALSEFSLCPLR